MLHDNGLLRTGCEFLFFDFFHPVVERDQLVYGDGTAMPFVAGDDSGGEVVRYCAIGLDAEDRYSFTAQAGIPDAQQQRSIVHRRTPHPAKIYSSLLFQPRRSILQESAPVLGLVGRRNDSSFPDGQRGHRIALRLPERHRGGWRGIVAIYLRLPKRQSVVPPVVQSAHGAICPLLDVAI